MIVYEVTLKVRSILIIEALLSDGKCFPTYELPGN